MSYFYDIRPLAGISDNPITMEVLEGWQQHTYVRLSRWERECIFLMDAAFRRAHCDVVKYHSSRGKITALIQGGKDWERARKNG